jgi:hypothetical protein
MRDKSEGWDPSTNLFRNLAAVLPHLVLLELLLLLLLLENTR